MTLIVNPKDELAGRVDTLSPEAALEKLCEFAVAGMDHPDTLRALQDRVERALLKDSALSVADVRAVTVLRDMGDHGDFGKCSDETIRWFDQAVIAGVAALQACETLRRWFEEAKRERNVARQAAVDASHSPWVWGDGKDADLATMSEGMVISITAGVLRSMLATQSNVAICDRFSRLEAAAKKAAGRLFCQKHGIESARGCSRCFSCVAYADLSIALENEK